QADGVLNLHLGLDLSNPDKPVPVLYDTTGLTLGARVLGTNLGFTAAIGPLGLFVRNGTVTLDRDGNPATTEPAQFTVVLAQSPTRRYLLSLSALNTNIVQMDLTGALDLTLPLFFPTETTPLGGPGNNNLRLTIGSLRDIAGTNRVTL